MMAFLSLLGNAVPWKIIGIGAGLLGVSIAFMLISTQSKTISRLEAERATAIATATANAAIAQYERFENLRIQSSADAAAAKKVALRHTADAHRRTILNAPTSDDAPLAPVLRRELDRLPESTAAETH